MAVLGGQVTSCPTFCRRDWRSSALFGGVGTQTAHKIAAAPWQIDVTGIAVATGHPSG
jgi:hypothetical protein